MHIRDLFSLEGKLALITGGEGRYGSCIVEGLVEAGARVITASPFLEAGERFAAELRGRGHEVVAREVDQGNHASVVRLREALESEFGGLDIFVNNAVARVFKGYDEGPIEDFHESMRINATGLFDISREMARLIARKGGGSIINICSMMGMFGPDLSNYEGTDMGVPAADYFFHKGGMFTLTRYLARVLARDRIRVNSISPGGLLGTDIQPERFRENYVGKVPVGRMAEHDDIKGVVVFLASAASAYIDGENILMDGGMHC